MTRLAIAVALALGGCAFDSGSMPSELDHPSDEPWAPPEDEAFDTEWEDPDAAELELELPVGLATTPEIPGEGRDEGALADDEELFETDETDVPSAPED